MTTLAVFPAARHARLTEAHAALLFGKKPLRALHRLSDGGVASDGVVVVEGPSGKLDPVRVLLPFLARSVVYVCIADADAAGFALSTSLDRAPGCTLSGPVGTVVLAAGVLSCERVTLPATTAPRPSRVDVQIEGERPRLVRGVAVDAGDVAAVYVVDHSGDLRPGTTATLL
jgi:propanediol utilization protein